MPLTAICKGTWEEKLSSKMEEYLTPSSDLPYNSTLFRPSLQQSPSFLLFRTSLHLQNILTGYPINLWWEQINHLKTFDLMRNSVVQVVSGDGN